MAQAGMTGGATRERTGWAQYATILLGIGGIANLIWGVVVLVDSNGYGAVAPLADSSFVGPLEFWGWVSVVWGVLLLVGAALLATGSDAGRVSAIVLASISLVFWLFAMPAFPLFALVVMVLDVLVLYGLSVHWTAD